MSALGQKQTCAAQKGHVRLTPDFDRKKRTPNAGLIKRYVVRSTPNLSDLIIDCAAKFLRYALNLLPRICAVLAFEREDIDYPKQAEEKNKTKEKLAHG